MCELQLASSPKPKYNILLSPAPSSFFLPLPILLLPSCRLPTLFRKSYSCILRKMKLRSLIPNSYILWLIYIFPGSVCLHRFMNVDIGRKNEGNTTVLEIMRLHSFISGNTPSAPSSHYSLPPLFPPSPLPDYSRNRKCGGSVNRKWSDRSPELTNQFVQIWSRRLWFIPDIWLNWFPPFIFSH